MKSLNKFYIAFVLVWTPVQMYLLHIDSIGRSITLLTVLVFLSNLFNDEYLKLRFDKSCVVLGLWTIYSIVNTILKGHDDPEMPTIWFIGNWLIAPFVVYTVLLEEFLRDKKSFLTLIVASMSVYAVLGILLGSPEGDSERNLNELGNSLPITLFVFVFFILVKSPKNTVSWFVVALLMLYIWGSGTRKAVFAVLIIVFSAIVSRRQWSFKRILLYGVIIVFVYKIGSNLLSNSLFADRMSDSIEAGTKENTTDIAVLSFLGDRTYMYIEGWDIFLDHKLTGVGLTNFRHYSKLDSFLHSEYMVQLAEGGLVSVILFLLFIYYIIQPALKRGSLQIKENVYCFGFMFSCIIIYLTTWTYNFLVFFMAYAYIHASFDINQKRLK